MEKRYNMHKIEKLKKHHNIQENNPRKLVYLISQYYRDPAVVWETLQPISMSKWIGISQDRIKEVIEEVIAFNQLIKEL